VRHEGGDVAAAPGLRRARGRCRGDRLRLRPQRPVLSPAVTHKRLLGGCHLTRPVVDLLTGAGFTIRELDVYYEKGSPKVVGANSLGVAQSPLT